MYLTHWGREPAREELFCRLVSGGLLSIERVEKRKCVLHLLPNREHLQAHGAALQRRSSSCCCSPISSDNPLHLLFLFILHHLLFIFRLLLQRNSAVRHPQLVCEKLSAHWSRLLSSCSTAIFSPNSWGSCWCCGPHPAVEGRLWSFGERGQLSVRQVWYRFDLYWEVLLGGAEP